MVFKVRICLFVLILNFPFLLFSQTFRPINPKVKVNGKILAHPWSGGMNCPQIMNADIDLDGIQDIVIFDRSGGVWLPFLSKQNQLVYSPEYKPIFPDIKEWVIMKDINGDGITDMFTYSTTIGVAGIDVWDGTIGTKSLRFSKRLFPNDRNNILYYTSGNSRFNAYTSNIDYPAIEDIDHDGDLDILSYEVGGVQIIWYKNLAADKGMPKGSFDLTVGDVCFGKILEDGFSDKITLSPNKDKCASGLWPSPPLEVRHSGSTVLAFDRDRDRNFDLLIGDISSASLIYLHNGGDSTTAWMDKEEIKFPSNTKSVDIPYFVSSFLADINNDGVKELFAASNFQFGSDNYHCLWRYDQDKVNPVNFNYVSNSFIINETIDLGESSFPAVADVNGDGLPDLVVGNGGYFDRQGLHSASLTLFTNTGTEKSPEFTLVDTNWLGFQTFTFETNNFAPAFGDIDHDGDLDLFVGESLGRIFFAENLAGKNKPMQFAPVKSEYFQIDIGTYSYPQIFDLDHDGLQDLIIGKSIGTMSYFKNTGTSSNPNFSAAPSILTLGDIDTRVQGFATGNAAPCFFSSNNHNYVAMGTYGKNILLYDIPVVTGSVYPVLFKTWGEVKEGDESHIAIADLDRNGKLDMIVGNQRGGLAMYETDLKSEYSVSTDDLSKPDIRVYPNPAKSFINIQFDHAYPTASYLIYNSIGQIMNSGRLQKTVNQIAIQHGMAGMYFLKIKAGENTKIEKILIH